MCAHICAYLKIEGRRESKEIMVHWSGKTFKASQTGVFNFYHSYNYSTKQKLFLKMQNKERNFES